MDLFWTIEREYISEFLKSDCESMELLKQLSEREPTDGVYKMELKKDIHPITVIQLEAHGVTVRPLFNSIGCVLSGKLTKGEKK